MFPKLLWLVARTGSRVLLDAPLRVLAVVAIIMVGKTIAAVVLVVAFRYPLNSALTIGASLAQIGEFSFVLAGLGVALKLLPVEGQSLIQAHIAQAAMRVIATPDALGVRKMVDVARALNPGIDVVVRSHNEEEAKLLDAEHVGKVFMGAHELAHGMAGHVLARMGRGAAAAH